MNGRADTNAAPSLVLAVLAAVYVWVSFDYDVGSQAMPWLAGVTALGLALADAVAKLRHGAVSRAADAQSGQSPLEPGAPQLPPHTSAARRKEAIALGWIFAFVALVVVFGFYAAIPFYVFCYLKLYADKPSSISAVTAFGVAGFLYLVFEVFMGYAIFGGLIGGDSL